MAADVLVLESPRILRRRSVALPQLGEDDGLLRVEACGLCGTDHEQFTGTIPIGAALIPGHESVGTIEAIGPLAAQRWGVDVGDRVAVEVFLSCRRCPACLSGSYRMCEHHGIADMYGFIPLAKEPGLWGGYASHQYLAPDSILHRVPETLDPKVATLFNPLGAGIRWGATVPQTGPGSVVCVLGPGIRGLSACAAAREAGAGFVMVTGLGPLDSGRLDLARSFGADLSVDVAIEDPVSALKAATGGALADVVIDVTAKAPSALGQAINLARPGGTVVLAGTRGSSQTPGFWPDAIVYKELRVLGALGVDSPAYIAALELLSSGRYPFSELPRQAVNLDGAGSLLSTMAGESKEIPPVHAVILP